MSTMSFNNNHNRESAVSKLFAIALIGICITTTTAARGSCERNCRIVAAKCGESCADDLIGKGRSALVETSRRTQCATECFTTKTLKEVYSTTVSDHVTEEERQTWNEELEMLNIDAKTLGQLCQTSAFKGAKVCNDKKNKQENGADLYTLTSRRNSFSHDDDKTATIPKRVIERLLARTRPIQEPIEQIRRRRSADSSLINICPNTTERSYPTYARHWRSGDHVQLLTAVEANSYGLATNFTKQGYNQKFNIVTSCGELVTNYEVAGYKNLHCKAIPTPNLADFMIHTKTSNLTKYEIDTKCRSFVNGVVICRDWVSLDTYCALHGTKVQ